MISPSVDLLFIAKAIERVGDPLKSIALFVIYVAKGDDIRQVSRDKIESGDHTQDYFSISIS